MKPRAVVLMVGLVTLGLALAVPVLSLAQERQAPPRTGGGNERTGTAVPRGGDTGGGARVATPPSGGSSGGGAAVNSGGSGGSGGGGMAVPRYGGDGTPSRGTGRAVPGAPVGQAVPPESRPRGDRPAVGQAVPRGSVESPYRPVVVVPGGYYGYSSYYPYSSWYPYWGYGWGSGWGLGLGFSYYDPFYFGWTGLPYYGYGYDPYYWGGYYGGYYGGGAYYSSGTAYYQGSIKLKVRPRHAEVYVDGFYVGTVDDFDGVFQQLEVTADPNGTLTHRIEIRAPGYQPVVFEVRLQPNQTITYRGDLQPAGPIR